MAKAAKRKYAPSASKDVKSEMHRYKRGTARSGPGGKAGKVKSRKQAIAIGLSKARKQGKKVPRKRASSIRTITPLGADDLTFNCHGAGGTGPMGDCRCAPNRIPTTEAERGPATKQQGSESVASFE
jgi:hypothetical protein